MPSFGLPSIPIPPLVATVFAHFPLVTYPSPDLLSTSAPSAPTLWLLGPPPSPTSSSESLDPTCREAQAFARFNDVKVEVRWLSTPAGAVEGILPSLHLPSGDLLSSSEVEAWLANPSTSLSPPPPELSEPEKDPTHQAYSALLSTTLLPAVLSSLYLSPSPPPPVVPTLSRPFLSAYAAYFASLGARRDRIAEVKRLRGGKGGVLSVLDLEEVEREGVETVRALEVKLQAAGGAEGWFGGSPCVLSLRDRARGGGADEVLVRRKPTALDARLYALLSIVMLLPYGPQAPLRQELERSPTLTAWVKRRSS